MYWKTRGSRREDEGEWIWVKGGRVDSSSDSEIQSQLVEITQTGSAVGELVRRVLLFFSPSSSFSLPSSPLLSPFLPSLPTALLYCVVEHAEQVTQPLGSRGYLNPSLTRSGPVKSCL